MRHIITQWNIENKPNGKFCFPAQIPIIRGVKTIDETRREKLELLLKKHKTFAQLNEALGWPRTDSRLSRIKNQNTRTDREGKVFQMGSPMAREIEAALELPNGWMDTPLTYADMHGEDDPRTKVMQLMEALPADQWATAVRLLDALAQPATQANGTTGHH